MLKNRILILFLMLLPLAGNAQGSPEYDVFAESAGTKSVLYRGQGAKKYNFRYNGHYFWNSREYKPGSLCYNGRIYTDVLLNVDAYEQELLTRASAGSAEVTLLRDYVEWFEIDGERFVNLEREGLVTNAEPGFYIEKRTGDIPVYYRVIKYITSNVSNNNGYSGIGYDDENYRSEVIDCFLIKRQYYTIRNGKLKKIGRLKAEQLLK